MGNFVSNGIYFWATGGDQWVTEEMKNI